MQRHRGQLHLQLLVAVATSDLCLRATPDDGDTVQLRHCRCRGDDLSAQPCVAPSLRPVPNYVLSIATTSHGRCCFVGRYVVVKC